MRPRLWDEQKIPTEYWNSKIKQPIRMLHLLYMCSMAVALYDPMLRQISSVRFTLIAPSSPHYD